MSEFADPRQCIDERDRAATHARYGVTKKAKGETRQVQCAKCLRWCYLADRCNLFDGLPQRRSSRDSEVHR